MCNKKYVIVKFLMNNCEHTVNQINYIWPDLELF